jgi:transcription termination/antitermination protein NusG
VPYRVPASRSRAGIAWRNQILGCLSSRAVIRTRVEMITETDRNWYALYVKSKHEFAVESELRRKEVNAFLPSVRLSRQWKDRKKFVDFPLFPGYLFVFIHARPEEYMNVLRTRGAVRLVSGEAGCPAQVSSEEIDALRLIMESGESVDIYPHLREGTPVRVKRGPLTGAAGLIIKKLDEYIFAVNVDILGRSVGVKIYADDIESA